MHSVELRDKLKIIYTYVNSINVLVISIMIHICGCLLFMILHMIITLYRGGCIITNSNMTSFFRFVNKRASYPFGIISLAHAPMNVTDFSIVSVNCNPNNADRGCSIIRVT